MLPSTMAHEPAQVDHTCFTSGCILERIFCSCAGIASFDMVICRGGEDCF